MQNEMMYMPLVVTLIVSTAILSAIVTTALSYMPKLWHAVKTRIKRKSTRKSATDIVDIILIAKLEERLGDVEVTMKNVADNAYRREQNRKNNIRREIRTYLEELRTNKND